MEKLPVRYKQDLVKRVVHIIRNPLDNIVARFHLERGRYASMKNETWLNEYPDDKIGFQVSRCLQLPLKVSLFRKLMQSVSSS